MTDSTTQTDRNETPKTCRDHDLDWSRGWHTDSGQIDIFVCTKCGTEVTYKTSNKTGRQYRITR